MLTTAYNKPNTKIDNLGAGDKNLIRISTWLLLLLERA